MFWNKKKNEIEEVKYINADIDEIRQAITKCANDLPLGVSLRSFVNDDYSLDYNLLKPVLKGIPKQTYYMSKETFEVFDNPKMAKQMDDVQRAVDLYYKEKGDLPVIIGPENKISFFLLKDYLRNQPEETVYINPDDQLVTYRPPNS